MSGRGAGGGLLGLEAIQVVYKARDGAAPVELLNGLSLTVNPGELVVVAGRSGSGKTTLLNVATALMNPTTGTVRWLGEDIAPISRDDLARRRGRLMGIVFQNAALVETLTAAENIALASVPTGIRDGGHRVTELLDYFGLEGRARHFPAQLSSGEQQRVALARALYADPPLLVVDEPTANLDRRTADMLIHLLTRLAGTERGLLVASHDPALISAASRVVELEPHAARAGFTWDRVRADVDRAPEK